MSCGRHDIKRSSAPKGSRSVATGGASRGRSPATRNPWKPDQRFLSRPGGAEEYIDLLVLPVVFQSTPLPLRGRTIRRNNVTTGCAALHPWLQTFAPFGASRVRRHPAFTLIEILVVFSIIALLLAILLPSLSGAREHSKTLLCQTHLRALSHGWHMYADDNDDVSLPGRYFNASGGTSNPANWYDVGNGMKYRPRWVATMGKYVGIFAFDEPRTDFDRQDYTNKVYECPAVPEWIDERNYAYGYNHQFLGNARKTGGVFHNFPVNRSDIASFAGTVLGADCMGTAAGLPADQRLPYANDGTSFAQFGNHGWTLDPPRLTASSDIGSGDPGSPRAAVDPRHQNRTNAVYCDGHAETQSPASLGYKIASDGRYEVGGPAGPGQPHNSLFSGTARDDDPPGVPGG